MKATVGLAGMLWLIPVVGATELRASVSTESGASSRFLCLLVLLSQSIDGEENEKKKKKKRQRGCVWGVEPKKGRPKRNEHDRKSLP